MTFFDYFQLAIVALVLCVIAFKAIYLRITTGINPIVIGRGTEGAWRVVEVLALASLLLWMAEVVLHATHSRFDMFPSRLGLGLLNTLPVRIVGMTLAGCGLMIFILAFFSFGNSWRIGIDRKTAGRLVTGGIFSVSRNPIYVAFDLIFTGIFLMNGTEFFLIFAMLAVVGVHAQILREEKFLTERYGEAYWHYREQTPRYLIW